MFERGDIIVSYSPATSCALRRLNQCQLRVHPILFAAELEAHFDGLIPIAITIALESCALALTVVSKNTFGENDLGRRHHQG